MRIGYGAFALQINERKKKQLVIHEAIMCPTERYDARRSLWNLTRFLQTIESVDYRRYTLSWRLHRTASDSDVPDHCTLVVKWRYSVCYPTDTITYQLVTNHEVFVDNPIVHNLSYIHFSSILWSVWVHRDQLLYNSSGTRVNLTILELPKQPFTDGRQYYLFHKKKNNVLGGHKEPYNYHNLNQL